MKIEEPISEGLTRVWDVSEVIHQEKTPYQELLIGKTAHGITLFCNNERQSSELTQLLYHECQIIPAVLMAEHRRSALVIGSSEGVVPQLLVKFGFESVEHVDIDEAAVRACAKYLPYGYTEADVNSYSVPVGQTSMLPIKLMFYDGKQYVRNMRRIGKKYDVICMDLPDISEGDDQHNSLYSSKFFTECKDILHRTGAFVTQAGCASLWRQKGLIKVLKAMREAFEHVTIFDSDEQDWAWAIGQTDSLGMRDPVPDELCGYEPRHIDWDVIDKATVLPNSVEKALYEPAS